MIRRLAALILLKTMSLIQTSEFPDQLPLSVVELGDSLNLSCSVSGNEAGLFYWYKLKFGDMVQTIAAGSFTTLQLQGQFDNSRFSITKDNGQYVLKIRNISKEDEATYYCQGGTAYVMQFINGTLLTVNDHKDNQKSFYVKQSPETESVQQGDPVTLQCSLLSKNKENADQCPAEHSVYWFRSGSGGSHPAVLYTHSGEERSCVHSLSTTIQNSSDTGTYYCAVVTCGQILFGPGTKVETKEVLCPQVIVLWTLLACCVIVIAALIIFIRKSLPKHCKGETSTPAEHDSSAEDHLNALYGEVAPLHYVALDFLARGGTRLGNNRELPEECLYSYTRDYQ